MKTAPRFSLRLWRALLVFGAAVLATGVSRAQLIDSYNADTLSLGTLTSWTDLVGGNNATTANAGRPAATVADTNSVFNGHNYVDFAGPSDGYATAGALFSGSNARSIAMVYDNPLGDDGQIHPIAGQVGAGAAGTWFDVAARDEFAAGDPYLAGYAADVSSGGPPVANRLTFAIATYDGTTETLYWAYGLTGTVQSASNTVALNTVANPFEIGYDSSDVQPSEGNMQIGQVDVFGSSMDLAQATTEIEGLQAEYETAIPEPSSYALIGVSLLVGTVSLRRRVTASFQLAQRRPLP